MIYIRKPPTLKKENLTALKNWLHWKFIVSMVEETTGYHILAVVGDYLFNLMLKNSQTTSKPLLY